MHRLHPGGEVWNSQIKSSPLNVLLDEGKARSTNASEVAMQINAYLKKMIIFRRLGCTFLEVGDK
jgi:hypothetical protein